VAVVAGDRVVRVGHEVFIPEAWDRADTEAQSRRLTISGAVLFAVVLAWLGALVVVLRRAPVEAGAPWPRAARTAALVGAAGAIAVLAAANDWGALMHGWDTAQPWDRHLLFVVLGLAGSALAPAGIWLLWRAVDAVRVRIGVPLRSPSARDAIVGGALLTLGPTVVSVLPRWVQPGMPTLPNTVLDAAVPWLAALFGPLAAGVAAAGGLALVAGALGAWRRPSARGVAVVGFALAFGVFAGAQGALTDAEWWSRGAVHAGAVVLAAGIVWGVGALSLEAWVVGGLLLGATGAVSSALVAATPSDLAAHLLGLVPLAGTLTWLVRRPR
jgi:hypothetical protein